MLNANEVATLFLRSKMFRAKVDDSVMSFKLKLKILDQVKTNNFSNSI